MKAKPLEFFTNYCGCWICISHRANNHGYSYIRHNGKKIYLHRFMYEKHTGPIPPGMCVLHHCDNPACNNPDHLFLGTMADNTRDMINKGRGRYRVSRGVDNGQAKLTEGQVRGICFATGTQQKIAERYGISQMQVSYIKRGERWRHLQLA